MWLLVNKNKHTILQKLFTEVLNNQNQSNNKNNTALALLNFQLMWTENRLSIMMKSYQLWRVNILRRLQSLSALCSLPFPCILSLHCLPVQFAFQAQFSSSLTVQGVLLVLMWSFNPFLNRLIMKTFLGMRVVGDSRDGELTIFSSISMGKDSNVKYASIL